MKKYHSTSVDRKLVEPHLSELIDRCGGAEKAAKYASIGTGTVYRIRHKIYDTVQHQTATKILLSLQRKRKEDRASRSTHQHLTDKQNGFAKIERNL